MVNFAGRKGSHQNTVWYDREGSRAAGREGARLYGRLHLPKQRHVAPRGLPPGLRGPRTHFGSPILYEKLFNLKTSSNEVYYTNSLILLIKMMLCSKLHCQIFRKLKSFSYKLRDPAFIRSLSLGRVLLTETKVERGDVSKQKWNRC